MKTIEMPDAMTIVIEAEKLTPEQRRELAMNRLRELVAYAKENSPYLAKLYKDIGNDFELTDLPVTEKHQLQENFNEWVTDRSVNKDDLVQHVKNCNEAGSQSPYLDKYSYVSTSGTTGAPFTLLRDDYHNKIHGALVNHRLMDLVSADTFSPVKNRIASVISTNPNVSSYSSFLRAKNAIPEYSQNMIAISVSQSIDNMVRELNEFQPTSLTGYPSVLVCLAEEQLKGNLDIKIKAAACSAEPLTPERYEILHRAFGCPILNNYCNTEAGEIAFSNGSSADLHSNEDWIIVEPINANGDPAQTDTYSDAVLVTDLSNYICPIIRYKLTDRIILNNSLSSSGENTFPVLKISGREVKNIVLCGKTILMPGIVSYMEEVDGMLKFQLAKTGEDTLEVRLIVEEGADFATVSRDVSDILIPALTNMGCSQPKVIIVNKEPLNNPRSGKLDLVVDEVKQA